MMMMMIVMGGCVKSERAGLKVLDEACPRETTEHGDFTVGDRLPCPWERRTVTGVGRLMMGPMERPDPCWPVRETLQMYTELDPVTRRHVQFALRLLQC